MTLRGITRRDIAGLLVALCIASGGIALYVVGVRDRHEAEARSALRNCQQIEIIKTEIRGTVQASLKRLPTIAYYKTHPDELNQALREARDSIRRFRENDCYRLPVVRDTRLRPGT